MQISSTLQNNFTNTVTTILPKNNSVDSQNNSTTESNTTNKDAYNYVDLGQDISAYTTTVDPVQQQTNKELISYLSNIMNDKTDEGKQKLQAYDLSFYYPVNADKKTIWGYDDEHPEEIFYGVGKVTQRYMNDLSLITKEDFSAIQLEKFKNLYSFSDAFAKTDKFQELYANYVKQNNNNNNNKQIEDALSQGKSMAETFGSKSFFTSQVGSQNLSKSEIIEHYTKISQDLHTLRIPPKDTIYGETYIKQIDDSIKLYEKITNDLKEMWHYGDFDMKN